VDGEVVDRRGQGGQVGVAVELHEFPAEGDGGAVGVPGALSGAAARDVAALFAGSPFDVAWLRPAAAQRPEPRLLQLQTGSTGADTVVAAPGLTGKVVTAALRHYSLTGLYDDVIGVPKLRDAATAPSFAAAFGLAVGP
jgi:hypothetical protein